MKTIVSLLTELAKKGNIFVAINMALPGELGRGGNPGCGS
jgi:hypothetical protein